MNACGLRTLRSPLAAHPSPARRLRALLPVGLCAGVAVAAPQNQVIGWGDHVFDSRLSSTAMTKLSAGWDHMLARTEDGLPRFNGAANVVAGLWYIPTFVNDPATGAEYRLEPVYVLVKEL